MFVKSIKSIGEKWNRVVSQRGPDYEAGVMAPRRDWATATGAAEANYGTGVTAAVANKSFGKGVRKAGSAKWLKGAREKGVARWPTGVAAAQPDFEVGYDPFRSALERKELSPRRAKRDPANLNRVKEVCDTMVATAKAQEGK